MILKLFNSYLLRVYGGLTDSNPLTSILKPVCFTIDKLLAAAY